MNDAELVSFLQWALPRLRMRWPGFRKVRRQVRKRLNRRLAELHLPDLWTYREYLEADSSEWSVLDSFCRITISCFYRDRGVFDVLRQSILPSLAEMVQRSGRHTLRCLSAGCASGEEAYTLSIIWNLSVSGHYPKLALEIIATDTDRTLLARAQKGWYRWGTLKDFPAEWLARAFTRVEGTYCIKPIFLKRIEFSQQDLRQQLPDGKFHLILCRNLAFTYFDEPLQRETLQRLVNRLEPHGFLVIGKHETLPKCEHRLEAYGQNMPVFRNTGKRD